MAKRIGELLVEAGVLSQTQLEQALFAQRKDGRKLGQVLIELGLVGEVQLTQALSRQLSVPWVSLFHVDFSRALLNLVPRAVAERYSLVPIFVRRSRNQGDTLYVAMDDPTADGALDEVSRAASLPVKPMIACPTDIRAAIRVYYGGEQIQAVPPSSAPVAEASTSRSSMPAESPKAGAAYGSARSEAQGAMATIEPVNVSAVRVEIDSTAELQDIDAEEREAVGAPKMRPRMISMTLLDGTTIAVPAPKRQPSLADASPPADASPSPPEETKDQLTARDLVSALRAVAHGVDASEILGSAPQWEAMFSALLSILLRKGLIADWEFIEEYRKV